MRAHHMGWDYSGSVLTCNATLSSHEGPEAVRKADLEWKEAKGNKLIEPRSTEQSLM